MLIIGFIFVLLGKIPLFRWIGIVIVNIIKYFLMTVFNILAILLLTCVTAAGVLGAFALFHYLNWELFMVGNEILIIGHDGFFTTAFLVGLFFVIGILIGTLIFSYVRLFTRTYVILCYITGIVFLFVILPIAVDFYAPNVDVSLLGVLAIAAIIPVLGIVLSIASSQNRKERRKQMSMEERRSEDWQDRERANFRKRAIFPWIKNRKRPI